MIGTLRRSQSVIRVYSKHTRLKNNSDGGIYYVSYNRSILKSICLVNSREDFRKGIGERTVSTLVGLLLIETTRGVVITWLACSHEDLDRHESMRKVLMSWIEKKEEQRNEWVFEKYFKRISLSKFMQEVVAALLKLGIIRAPSATHIRASVWIRRTNLIGTLRRSRSVTRVYFYITQDSKIIPTEAQIPSVSFTFTRSILNSICLFHSREDFRKGIGERCRILPLRVTCTRRSGPFRNDNGVSGRRE